MWSRGWEIALGIHFSAYHNTHYNFNYSIKTSTVLAQGCADRVKEKSHMELVAEFGRGYLQTVSEGCSNDAKQRTK